MNENLVVPFILFFSKDTKIMAKNTTNLVSVDSLIFADNVRSEGCMNLPKMIDSIKRHGFKNNHPLVVSQKGEDEYLVLCGNRRGLALCFLRDNEPDEFGKAVKGGKIPAIIYSGLTPTEEVLIRIDHSSDEDREPLDQWSEFLAIRQLVLVGHDVQEQIANKLGIFSTKGKNKGKPNRPYVQVRVNLAKLPEFVQTEVKKTAYADPTAFVLWSDIASLYKAYNSELVEFPNGDGPAFTEAWNNLKNRPKRTKGENQKDGKTLTPAGAKDRASSCSSSLLRFALLGATQQGGYNLVDIDNKIKRLEDLEKTVNIVKEFIGEGEWDSIVNEAVDAYNDSNEVVEA